MTNLKNKLLNIKQTAEKLWTLLVIGIVWVMYRVISAPAMLFIYSVPTLKADYKQREPAAQGSMVVIPGLVFWSFGVVTALMILDFYHVINITRQS